jgi:hypothetical protein
LAGRVLLKIVYLLTCRVLGVAVLVFRGDRAKDAELLVLRHEHAVLRRHVGRVRYEPGDRVWFTALGTAPTAQALDRHRPCDARNAPHLAPQASREEVRHAQAAQARPRLETFINALAEASIPALTDDELAAYDGSTGLDATPVPLFSRGPSRRAGLCAGDPDGGWYVREGDHREDGKGKPLRKIVWALEATIATMARPPGAPPACPNLAAGLALTRPGQDPGGTGARVLACVAARGRKTGWPGYDRACTDALPGRFHLPARALGYQPVMDYKTGQPGIQGSAGGAILTEGSWYCPAMPEPLVTATTGLRNHAIDRDLYQARIAARAPYRLKRKDGPDADGYERLTCPALGSHPGLACPLRPGSLSPRDGRPKILTPPEEPPRICQQAAITIPPGAGARYRQGLPYGSEAWHARYATLRNTIEGLNGFVKDPAHEALAQPGRRRVRGIAAQPVFTALLLAAANIRKIRAWRELTPAGKTRIACRARRRRTSLGDYLPDG